MPEKLNRRVAHIFRDGDPDCSDGRVEIHPLDDDSDLPKPGSDLKLIQQPGEMLDAFYDRVRQAAADLGIINLSGLPK